MENAEQKKIMLLDDDSFLRDIYTKKFKAEGYDTTAYSNVQEALDSLRDGFTPDLVLSDVIMPGKTAWDFLKEVRQDGLIPNATIILLTNEDDDRNVERSKEFSVAGYIIKALMTPSEVVEKVKEIYGTNQK